MLCNKCGNKLPPNATYCKYCGYQLDDEEKEIIEVKEVKKETKQIKEKEINTTALNKIFVVLSILLILVPFIFLPLAYLEYQLSSLFFVCVIISLFVQLLGTFVLNNLVSNSKRINTLTKYSIFLGITLLIFSLTFIIASIALEHSEYINDYQNLIATLLSIGTLGILFPIELKLLQKYS